jgi:Spy/CpxP family protein refolding chaperone
MIVKIRAEIWPILTPDQQQKMISLHARLGHRSDDEMQALAAFLRGA